MKKIPVLLILVVTVWSCGKNEDEKCAFIPETTGRVEVSLEMLEDSLVNVRSKPDLVAFLTRHPMIRHFALRRPDYPNDSVFINEVYNRFSNPHLDSLLVETRAVFGDGLALKTEFNEAFTNLNYYYPGVKLPRIQTVVTGLMGNDLFVSDSLIIVSLDYFLGPGARFRPQVYDYLLRQYKKDNIVPSCMLIYGIGDRFNKTDLADKSILADMIAYGKSFHFAKRMLPCVPDSTFIWYTPEEIGGSRKNQDLIWARLVQDEVLYSTSHLARQKYLGERPKTLDVGPDCPGRIGQWVGWQIVDSYMESNDDVTLPELMQNANARKILEASEYTRKFRSR